MRGRRRAAALAGVLLAALWYLRDPAWVAGQTTGMWDWERAADGTRYRWANSNASFFVPSDASEARVRLSTTFDEHGSEPMVVSVSVDDVRCARVLLTAPEWHEIVIPLPPRGSRRERRIDVRANRARDELHAVRISDVQLTRAPR